MLIKDDFTEVFTRLLLFCSLPELHNNPYKYPHTYVYISTQQILILAPPSLSRELVLSCYLATYSSYHSSFITYHPPSY